MAESRTVGVLGLGYVGLPLSCAAVGAGHRVVGYDPDHARATRLRSGSSPVEDVADRLLEKSLASGLLSFTEDASDLGACNTFVICVPTPLHDKTPD